MKKAKKPAKLKVNAKKSNRSENIQHYNAILIEELRSEFKFVVEKVMSIPEQIRAEMNPRFDKIEQELSDIRAVVEMHSRLLMDNEKRWNANDKRWDEQDKRWDEQDKRWKEEDIRWAEQKKQWENNEKQWEDNRKLWELNKLKLQEIISKIEASEKRNDRQDDEIFQIKNRMHL